MKAIIVFFVLFWHYSNSFSQWDFRELNSGVTVCLNSASIEGNIYFVNPYNGWVCGDSGTVLTTTNSGVNWINVSGHGIPITVILNSIYALSMVSAITAGYTSSNAFLWKTTNSGNNWFQVFNQPGGKINSVKMKNATTGFMYGDPVGGRWSLWKTVNGGVNWDSTGLYLIQTGNEKGFNNSLYIDTNRIWFGTDNYRIYYSSNFGSSWIIQSTLPEKNIYSICFKTGGYDTAFESGYASSSTLLKTTNRGINWNTVTIPDSGNIHGLSTFSYYSEAYGWISRLNKLYFKESIIWLEYYTAPDGNYTASTEPLGEFGHSANYFVRDNGGITFIVRWEGVKKISSDIPQQFSLFQNYPNPFNPSTKIKFEIPNSPFEGGKGDVKLVIYDVLGQQVAELINQGLSPGTYEVEWNASGYPSGIYFYTLKTESFNQTKRMVLVK